MADSPNAGWVYVMTHPAWTKIGMVKVGCTSRDPARRAREICSSSGLIAPGKLHHTLYVSDRWYAEAQMHYALRRYRVTHRREFFRCTPEQAASVMAHLAPIPVPPSAPRKRWTPWWLFKRKRT